MAFRKLFRRGGGDARRFAADWLVVGLGNPGEQYAGYRHNVGFWVVNDLAKRAGVQPKATGSTMAIAVGEIADSRVALVKPRTYYNVSGKAVALAQQWTGCDTGHLVVVYDELDLPVGALRIRRGGGHGGNNGIKSIAGAVGPDFARIRIGIGRPSVGGEPTWESEEVRQWVLSRPYGEDAETLHEITRLAADAVAAIISDGVDVAGSRYNRK
ncbi:MAG: aminoacyl-tRNA hydrolase [Dehalococcoidia bacterium]